MFFFLFKITLKKYNDIKLWLNTTKGVVNFFVTQDISLHVKEENATDKTFVCLTLSFVFVTGSRVICRRWLGLQKVPPLCSWLH